MAFGYWASLFPDNITLNPPNKTDQRPADYETGIGTVATTTLDTEQLISCIRAVPVDTVTSLQCSDGGLQLEKGMYFLLRFMTFWTGCG